MSREKMEARMPKISDEEMDARYKVSEARRDLLESALEYGRSEDPRALEGLGNWAVSYSKAHAEMKKFPETPW